MITSGAYTKPKIAPNTILSDPVIPAYTTEEMTEPIFHPIGPSTKCAAITESTKLQKGTTIIEITDGQIFLKNFSRYTSVNAARIAGMT